MGEGIRCNYYDYQNGYNWKDCDWFWMEMIKNLNIIKHCDGDIWDSHCVTKDFRAGDKVYADVQGVIDSEKEKYFQENCYGFSERYLNKAQAHVTNSGYIIIPYYHSSSGQNAKGIGAPIVLVDINGQKAPNKWGHDIFIFLFTKIKKYDSIFSMKPTKKCHPLDKNGYYTTHFFNYLYGQQTNY